MQNISRKAYSDLYGITIGDSVRLADTDLWAKVEEDLTKYGEEAVFGGGKTLRDGMGQNPLETRSNAKVMDLIITNALIIDHRRIYKADIGIKDGKFAAIGHAGNPMISNNIDMICGVSTEVFSGEGKIFVAGGLDTHVHWLEPEICQSALDGGITTLIVGGTGLNDGSKATTVTPGAWWMERMLQSADDVSVNVGFLGKGQGATEQVLVEQIEAGACGLKIHEDWGATASAIDQSLKVADKMDVQVSIHTDTLNECGFAEHTVRAINGRVIHAYHCEGAGGGHAPDIMIVTSLNNILPSSTNPTLPFTINTIAEHLDMLMVCHHLNPKVPEDVAFADSRIRKETIAAEDILHDMGAISMTSSDTMAMGRISEVATRTWQVADKMKANFGPLAGDNDYSDNNRIKRYVAKYTINPAITHGVADYVGSIDLGKIADLVCYEPKFFGVKPFAVFKAGILARGMAGESNASIPTCEPIVSRDLWATKGSCVNASSVLFISQAAAKRNIKKEYGLKKTCLPVRNCRNVFKKDMVNNTCMPRMHVDPQMFDISIDREDLMNWINNEKVVDKFRVANDGKLFITAEPLTEVSLAQRFFLY